MLWNWQTQEWPNFAYRREGLEKFDLILAQRAGFFSGTFRYAGSNEQNRLMIDLISDEALKTSAIEGEILDRASVQSSLRQNFGLDTGGAKAPPAEQGIAEMMVDLYRSYDRPLTHEQMFTWHGMLTLGRRDLHSIGAYRTHAEPMQVVSNALQESEVHFEAPPSSRVLEEMTRFIEWFNATAPGQTLSLPAIIRAGIAHLYFVSIHPFEDGNGRIGRVLAEKALSQNLGQPTLIALSHSIERHRKNYYRMLELYNKDMEITGWLAWFAEIVLAAQERTQGMADFLIAKTRLFDRVKDRLNARQEKALTRMFREGPGGFTGGLSAEKYIKITGASRATATRDLQGLVAMGALVRTGELRYARYGLTILLDSSIIL